MKKRYVNLILAMVSASAMALGSVPAMAAPDSAKTASAKNDSKEDAEASNEKEADAAKTDTLEDGVYTAEFDTDSSMFHVNEANDEKGELTVKDGKMTIHVSLVSKKIVNLFAGTAEDAQKDGAEIIEPTTDTVKYSDGYTEEVYGVNRNNRLQRIGIRRQYFIEHVCRHPGQERMQTIYIRSYP